MSVNKCTVLVADDDKFIRDIIADLLRDLHGLLFASTTAETWRVVVEEQPDIVLLDIKFPDSNDLSLLKRIKTEFPEIEVIMISSQTENIPQIVQAMKLGAYDFVPKPIVRDELLNRIEKAWSHSVLRKSQKCLLEQVKSDHGIDSLVGNSSAMARVRESIQRVSDLDGCVLIRGESGTGKELTARAIHYWSRRRSNPFVVCNCAGVPDSLTESVFFGHERGAFTGAVQASKGYFEAAGNGTLFLDEIGDMPLTQQTSLLRVIEYKRFMPIGSNKERQCNARLVFATNRDLRELVDQGKFREDLFYRINVASITLPSLRQRPEDIPVIVDYYSKKLAIDMGRPELAVAPEAVAVMQQYDWPGNVRELRNVLEAIIMLSDPNSRTITVQDLPAEILAVKAGKSSSEPEEKLEKQELLRALIESKGSLTEAAKILGCHRNTIRTKIKYFGLTDFLSVWRVNEQ